MAANEAWSKAARPKLVSARHPRIAGQFVTLAVHPDTWARVWNQRLRKMIGQYAGLVHGSYVEAGDESPALTAPTGIFRGLKRPLYDFNGAHDTNVYAYVTNPKRSFYWPVLHDVKPEDRPKSEPPPTNSVFVTFVDFTQRAIAQLPLDDLSYKAEQIDGVVHWWAWHRASENDSFLPFDYRERYEERVL